MLFEKLFLKIRRRETPFYKRLYHLARFVNKLNMPVVHPFHSLLYSERELRLSICQFIKQFFYYVPLFKTRCKKVGIGLNIFGGIPQIYGSLSIILGDNVTLHGVSTFVGIKTFEKPTLTIGDNTHIGYQVGIFVGRDITIGNNVLIGNRIEIFSDDMHPIEPERRILHEPSPKQSSKSVIIEDNVWIASNSVICKGVRIGRGAVVANSSVVTKDVPPYVVVAGNPARIVKRLDNVSA